jgi:hypothetical protein
MYLAIAWTRLKDEDLAEQEDAVETLPQVGEHVLVCGDEPESTPWRRAFSSC